MPRKPEKVPESIDPESREWIELAQQQERPYGYNLIGKKGNHIWAVSTIRDDSGAISDSVSSGGHIVWRLINPQPRPRSANWSVKMPADRITIVERGLEGKDELPQKSSIDAFNPGTHSVCGMVEESVRFAVSSFGSATVRTTASCAGSKSASFSSIFTTRQQSKLELQKEQQDVPTKKDYLVAGLKAASKIPWIGGPILGIIHLVEAYKGSGEAVGDPEKQDLVQELVDASIEKRDALLIADLAILGHGSGSVGNTVQKMLLSKWPFPFSEETLITELNTLFGEDPKPLRVALSENKWSFDQQSETDQIIRKFVLTIEGQISRLPPLLKQLIQARPDSAVIKLAIATLEQRTSEDREGSAPA